MSERQELGWLLTRFGQKTPGVIVSTVVSVDGLLVATSDGLDDVTADQVAALVSSLSSVSAGASAAFDGGRLAKVLVAYANGYLLLSSLGESAVLAVLSAQGSDVAFIGAEMGTLGQRVGAVLAPALRETVAAGRATA